MLKSVKAWFVNHLTVKIALSILLLQLFTSAAFAFSGYYVNQNLIGKLLEQFDMRLQTDIQIAADVIRPARLGYGA